MSHTASGDEHVQLWLGLYVLGALSTDEHALVEEHLSRCAQCQTESDELGEVPALLSLLSDEDVRILADEFGTSGPLPAPAVEHAGSEQPQVGVPAVVSGSPVRSVTGATRPGGRLAPASPGRGSTGRTSTGRDSPRPGRLGSVIGRGRLVLAALMVTLVAGIGIGVWLQGPGGSLPPSTPLAASATDKVSGAGLSVVVTGRVGGSRVEATATALRAGVQYQLIAVTVHGETEVVAQWVGADGAQAVQGNLDVAPQDLAFFTVTQLDGAVVVSVRFATSTP